MQGNAWKGRGTLGEDKAQQNQPYSETDLEIILAQYHAGKHSGE